MRFSGLAGAFAPYPVITNGVRHPALQATLLTYLFTPHGPNEATPMNPDGSVSRWLGPLREGDEAAIQALWERYFDRLVRLARAHFGAAPRRVADEEDAALSAFDSFCRRAGEGRFPRLADRDDLWRLLATITECKAANLLRAENALVRGGGRERSEAGLADVLAREPDPAFAAAIADEFRNLLDQLPDDEHRQVAVWKLEGHTNKEIAGLLNRHVSVVERRLGKIRRVWNGENHQ
jgi:DNA-directed RNA polymerase specialized sigma24 family protein